MSEWQLIATLPPDLIFFMAAWTCSGSETGYDVGEVFRDGNGFFALMGRLDEPPTHWMPLPAAPLKMESRQA